MPHLHQYLLSVIAAATICTVIRALTHKRGASATIINLVSAVFLVTTVLLPWSDWSLSDISEHIKEHSEDAQTIVDNGVSFASAERVAIIKQETETYIVNKAESLGVVLTADVTLCDGSSGQPESVRITATTTPYLRQVITQFVASDLGIPEARQAWN